MFRHKHFADIIVQFYTLLKPFDENVLWARGNIIFAHYIYSVVSGFAGFAFISTSCESGPVRPAFCQSVTFLQHSSRSRSWRRLNITLICHRGFGYHAMSLFSQMKRGGKVALNNTLLIGCVLRLISIKRLRAAHLSWQGLELWLFSPLIREILILLEPRRAMGHAVK